MELQWLVHSALWSWTFMWRSSKSWQLHLRCSSQSVGSSVWMTRLWIHREEEHFLVHLNSVHPCIQSVMEKERDNQLAFLNILVLYRANSSLGHKVYRQSLHTDRYLDMLKSPSNAEVGSAEGPGCLGEEDLRAPVSRYWIAVSGGCVAVQQLLSCGIEKSSPAEKIWWVGWVSVAGVCRLGCLDLGFDGTHREVVEMRCQDSLQADQENLAVPEISERCQGFCCHLEGCIVCLDSVARYISAPRSTVSAPTSVNTVVAGAWASQRSLQSPSMLLVMQTIVFSLRKRKSCTW